jgi:thiol-disulfide isomerase/thioredoxin
VLPLLDKDSILIQISSNRISVSYLNAGTQYRLRENVVSDWLNGCSALPMQEGSDPIKVKIAKTKSKWACHYRNIYNARSKSDAFDTATQAFLNLYEAYGLINEEVNLMRVLSITGKRDRIGKDNLRSFFSVIGGSPLDDNVMVHNALLGYFHQLEKSGFEGGDYRKALQHIDTLWKSSPAKMRFFQKLIETEWAEGALSEEIADVMNLSLPAKKERVDKKATATNAPIVLPKSVAHYQDEVVFSDGNVSSIDSLLTDTTHVLKLVDFWASWCYPCRMAYKNSEVLRKKLQSKGVQIIYVSTDKIETSWINANKQENLEATGISVRLVQPQTANIIQQLMIFAIPRYLLFDKSGKLLNANMPGFKEAGLLPKIEKYLRAAGN